MHHILKELSYRTLERLFFLLEDKNRETALKTIF